MNARILCVDDEPAILAGFQRSLRREFTVDVAAGGQEALARLAGVDPYAVVVSDMHMPGMDGVRFLARVREIAPLTVRMMLTGNSSVDTAIEAVNEGHIFRFLTKPCPAETLAKALQAGVDQYRLLTAEKDLLERTLKGTVNVLADLLTLVNPAAFGRAARVRRLAERIADARPDGINRWELEVAALLSQIGCVTLPDETVDKVFRGKPLAAEEAKIFAQHPKIGHDLLVNIPRLEAAAAIIAYQDKRYDGSGTPADAVRGDGIPLGARILKIALDCDTLVTAGMPVAAVLSALRDRVGCYDPALLEALSVATREEVAYVIRDVEVEALRIGMRLAVDLRSASGLLLIGKGQEVTASLKVRLANMATSGGLPPTLKVLVPVDRPQAAP
jgi:response regulator RpfG family c-di-GMP phosphodiesterase